MTEQSLDLTKWIEEETIQWQITDSKIFNLEIGKCLPQGFESHCKIFYPFEQKKSHDQSIALIEENEKNSEFIKWKKIADEHDLVFHNQLSLKTYKTRLEKKLKDEGIEFPKDGSFNASLFDQLLSILKAKRPFENLYIYQKLPHSIWKNKERDILYLSSWIETMEYFNEGFTGYVFPEDKSWIVFADINFPFALVGGGKEIIEAIVSSELEAIECSENTRVDEYSDEINLVSEVKPSFFSRRKMKIG